MTFKVCGTGAHPAGLECALQPAGCAPAYDGCPNPLVQMSERYTIGRTIDSALCQCAVAALRQYLYPTDFATRPCGPVPEWSSRTPSAPKVTGSSPSTGVTVYHQLSQNHNTKG